VLLRVMLTIVLLAVCVALVWPRPGGLGRRVWDARSPNGARLPQDSWPESLEGVLARQLTAGRTTRSQYLQAMARLAERDAQRHPLEPPRD
jgi:hypothetical protein